MFRATEGQCTLDHWYSLLSLDPLYTLAFLSPGVMMKYLALALMCVQEKAVDRPAMSDVVAMLSSDDITLPEPRQPAYSCVDKVHCT